MIAKTMRNGAAVLLFLGAFVFYSGPARAEPVDHPDKCTGPVPDWAFSCEKPICTADGDRMCCTSNKDGGYDCCIPGQSCPGDALSGAKGSRILKLPANAFQEAPVNPPPTSTPKAPITRAGEAATSIAQVLPNPVVAFTGKENYQANGQNWTRYKLAVKNYTAYPNAMFAPAPFLPPCGANKNSSRTWVNIYHYVTIKGSPQYIYGFCALSSANDLVNLWFASPAGKPPPSPVVVVLEDRQMKKNYISNTVAIPAK